MTTFKKYEFTDLAEWSKFQAKIQVKSTDEEGVDVYTYKDVAVVELGHICKAYEVNEEGFEYAQTLQQLGRLTYYGLEPYYLHSNRLRCIQILAASIPLLDARVSI
jgi:GTP cyclohydrolase II